MYVFCEVSDELHVSQGSAVNFGISVRSHTKCLNVQRSGQSISLLHSAEIFYGSLVGYLNHIFNYVMTQPSVCPSTLSSW